MDHEWQFFGVSEEGSRYVISVCIACGEARYKSVFMNGGPEHRVDLSGDCPGRPQRPSVDEERKEAGLNV